MDTSMTSTDSEPEGFAMGSRAGPAAYFPDVPTYDELVRSVEANRRGFTGKKLSLMCIHVCVY